jgi:glucose/arabinose dehydrogenase
MAFRPTASRPGIASLLLGLTIGSACGGSSNPPTPPSPGPDGGDRITGRERIGWAQLAVDSAQLATFGYAVYVDGTRNVLTGESCAAAGDSGTFECSAPLPSMTPGQHTIELASFIVSGDTVLESERSAVLRVTVTGSTTPADTTRPENSSIVTSDGHRFRAVIVARGLDDPTDLAVARDGRVFVAERAGRVRVVEPSDSARSIEAPALELDDVAASEDSGLTAIALHPDFDRNGLVYIAYAIDERGGPAFRIARFRERNGILAQGAVIARSVESSSHAAMRFGPDGRLYVGFSSGDDPGDAQSASSVLGKILRMNDDGTTPRDNPRASVTFSSGHREPRALAWQPSSGALWELDRDRESGDELNSIVGGADYGWPLTTGAESSARSVPASLVLAAGTDVSGGSFVPINANSPLAGELLVASRGAEDLLRIRLGSDGGRPGLVEGMLQGRYGRIAAVHVSSDGTIYLATANRDTWGVGQDVLIRLSPGRRPGL